MNNQHDIIKLSEHFELSEFLRSETAARYGYTNTLETKEQLENLKRLCIEILEPCRAAINEMYGPRQSGQERSLIILSGYRCVQVNKLVGGSRTSNHTKALAADWYSPGLSIWQCFDAISQTDIAFNELIVEFQRWIHTSTAPRNGVPHGWIREAVRRPNGTTKYNIIKRRVA